MNLVGGDTDFQPTGKPNLVILLIYFNFYCFLNFYLIFMALQCCISFYPTVKGITIHVCIFIQVYMCIHMYVYTSTHIDTHIITHMHVHIHTFYPYVFFNIFSYFLLTEV